MGDTTMLTEAVRRMSSEDKKKVISLDKEGKDYKDIALELELTPSQVGSFLWRRKNRRKILRSSKTKRVTVTKVKEENPEDTVAYWKSNYFKLYAIIVENGLESEIG